MSALILGTAAAMPHAAAAQAAGSAPLPEICGGADVMTLSALDSWQADLVAAEARCLAIALAEGELLRVVVALDARPPLTGAVAQLYAPGGSTPAVQAVLGNDARSALALHAPTGGTYHLVVRDAWTIDPDVGPTVPVRAWIQAVEPPGLVRARRTALAEDPRVAWLQAHAHRLRSIDAADDDVSDLEPLRGMLADARIVLLGESSHQAGSDLAAKSRIARFLHSELGFDVLAMEAGMFGMAAANAALRDGQPARQAFALGAWPFWTHAEQMQPLIDHLAGAARGRQPLELAGFDIQFVRPGAAEHFAAELAAFLHQRGIASPLTEAGREEARVLDALAMVRYRTGEEQPPPATTRAAFLTALHDLINGVDALSGDEAQLWSRILRSAEAEARYSFARADGADIWQASRIRNDMMAANLIWLATERFADRRIIVWAGSAHLMPLTDMPPAGGEGPSMGLAVRQHFGDETFVIVPTSFEGPTFAAEQHPLADFETLMAQAGIEHALVDLRAAARDGAWLGGPFLARVLTHAPEERVWSDVADALLFIRRYEPSRSAAR